MHLSESLPEPLPPNPLTLFSEWFKYARDKKVQNNPDSMTLATVDSNGHPSARVVLCKYLIDTDGYVVFFTNYLSRKGQELDVHPHAAAVFHWDALDRQVRLEGRIVRSPVEESDEYFRSRAWASQIGAWASHQSQPLASRAQLAAQVATETAKYAMHTFTGQFRVPRPPHWGGYRLWIENLELWCSGISRIHDRARWSRALTPKDEYSFHCGEWSGTRLNP